MVTTDKDTRLGRPRFDDDTIISSKSFSIFFLFPSYFTPFSLRCSRPVS